jgi:caffeoyl-CoA O-methyltransferase
VGRGKWRKPSLLGSTSVFASNLANFDLSLFCVYCSSIITHHSFLIEILPVLPLSLLSLAKRFYLDLINPNAELYAARWSSAEDIVLKMISEETEASHSQPHMLSGHLQGQFLEMISKLTRPKRILEIGTMVGYSSICLAKGLAAGGVLHTIEMRPEDAAIARSNFSKAGVQDKIQLHVGNALAIIPQLHETWDLVFIDADKTGYGQYYEMVKPRLRSGGLLLADNVLFHGEVLEDPIKGKNAKAIHAFNEMVAADEEVEKIILTLRDGLFLIRKK